MTTRRHRAPATAQPNGRIGAGAHSARQERSRLAQVSENEECGILMTQARARGRLRPGQPGWNRRRRNGSRLSMWFSCLGSRTCAGLIGGPSPILGPAACCRTGWAADPSARDGALRSAALPGRADQHHAVWGAGLRVSFPKPPVPVVRWNLAEFVACMAIPSGSVAARTGRRGSAAPPGSSRRKRYCVSTAPGRWPYWGSASYQTVLLPKCTVSSSRRWRLRIGVPPGSLSPGCE